MRDVRSLPPAEVAIASILASGLWALQTRSWRRAEWHMKTATIMPDKAPIYPASISRLGGGGGSERRVLCANIMGVTQSIVEPEKDARLRHHPSILGDPDETPENPDAPDNGDRKPAEGLVNELESRLFKGRKVMVFGQITDKLARDVVSRVLALVDESAKPIQIYVNSPGGHVESGDSIHDIIKFVRSTVPIYMIGTGWVASAGVLIYLAGENKMRFCLPNTRFLLHQPMGGVHGPATDIDIEARELVKMHERLVQIIATDTGQSVERVRKDTDRNYWMSAPEAIEYGLASKIISSIKDLK